MDENGNPDEKHGEETTAQERVGTKNIQEITGLQDDAGPSGAIPLPGAVSEHTKTVFQAKPGLSKSEHNIRQFITSKDVANALKSLSFGNPDPINHSINLNELKIPMLDRDQTTNPDDSTSFVDLKKFIVSCFKFNKDGPNNMIVEEVPTVTQPLITNIEIPNTSCNNVQTENPPEPNVMNEVIITNTSPVETKVSKVSDTNKKKTSGNLSERSEFGLGQRDSLSSIGSNVCRICMTRGRERFVGAFGCLFTLRKIVLKLR